MSACRKTYGLQGQVGFALQSQPYLLFCISHFVLHGKSKQLIILFFPPPPPPPHNYHPVKQFRLRDGDRLKVTQQASMAEFPGLSLSLYHASSPLSSHTLSLTYTPAWTGEGCWQNWASENNNIDKSSQQYKEYPTGRKGRYSGKDSSATFQTAAHWDFYW